MEVILKEDVAKLGARGDVVKVADGFGRNYLLPRKLAMEATRSNRAVVDQMRAASVRRSASDKADAELLRRQRRGGHPEFHQENRRKRPAFRLRNLIRHRRRACRQGLYHRSPQDPTRRAHQGPRRGQCSH